MAIHAIQLFKRLARFRPSPLAGSAAEAVAHPKPAAVLFELGVPATLELLGSLGPAPRKRLDGHTWMLRSRSSLTKFGGPLVTGVRSTLIVDRMVSTGHEQSLVCEVLYLALLRSLSCGLPAVRCSFPCLVPHVGRSQLG